MPSVVILHAADDALPARALGEKLRQANLTPVIEKAAGEDRQNAIKNAAAAIALWSPRSIADAGVTADVAFARGKGKLVHACMQSVRPPGDFSNEQWVDLTGWRGEDDFAAWLQLAGLITSIAGVTPMPPPPPKPPSGFFEPGRVGAPPAQQQQTPPPRREAPPQPAAHRAAPPPVAPPPPRPAPEPRDTDRGGGPNMALIGIVTFLVVAAVGGGGYYFWSQSQNGAGAAAAWERVDRTSPAELRAFLEGNPGALRDEAREALSELEQSRYAEARAADSIEALEAFAADFPSNANILAVRGRIAELRSLPATPAENELPAEVTAPAAPVDPDLLPPSATTPEPTPPPAATGGPVPLQPAQPEPEPETPEEPDDAINN